MDHHGGKEERGWRKGEKTDDAFISLKKERARDSTNIQHLQGQKRYIWFNVSTVDAAACVRVYTAEIRGGWRKRGGERLKACFYKLTIAS